VKKFLSIIMAMLLIVSLSATTAVAFAEGEEQTQYTLTYAVGDNGEGTAPEAKSYAAGTEVTLAAANTFTAKKGFEFNGWLVEGESENRAAGSKYTMPEKNITVTAQWTTIHTVTIADSGKALFESLAKDEGFENLKIQMGDVKFGKELMKNAESVKAVFEGIKYVDEDTETEKKANNDKIYVEYCRPSESPKGQETWQNSTLITNNIKLSSSGWYLFRIVVKDSTGKNVLATSEKFSRWAEDTENPVVSLSSTMKDKVKNGLTAGTKYSVTTSLSITDSSSTTVTYKIYKFVDGKWTENPIYDSVTKEVAEGYEKFISSDGAITPSKEDVSADPVYKIVYSVVDSNGYVGVENDTATVEFNPEMALFVNPEKTEKSKVNVWEIVLFCIAGAAAIGIVVLLCIKPKQPDPARQSAAKSDESDKTEE